MDKIYAIAILISIVILYAMYFYHIGKRAGYRDRENEFQNNPVQFCVGGGYPIVMVSHTNDGNVTVRIFDKKFVKIIQNSPTPLKGCE